MNNSNKIISLSAGVVALVAVVGLSLATFAQSNGQAASTLNNQNRFGGRNMMTEEARTAWIAEKDAQREAMDTAVKSGYPAWVEAVKKYQGESAPILSEVTEANFPAFQTAHEYMQEARSLMDKAETTLNDAGINRFGGRMGFGGKGLGRGAGGCHTADF